MVYVITSYDDYYGLFRRCMLLLLISDAQDISQIKSALAL